MRTRRFAKLGQAIRQRSCSPPSELAGQLAMWDPAAEEMTLIDTCYSTHHLVFAEDDDNTLWTSGGGQVIGWLNTYNRPDFWTTTSNKQLNFVQHVKSMLKIPGRSAVVVPDNVLFEGGAGEKVRRKLLQECEVHTLLRLPTGIFYAQGMKANVIFFDRKPGVKEPWTKKVWIYDCRTNKEFTLKERRIVRADLDEFVECYHPENRHQRKSTWNEKKSPEGRWRGFTYEEIVARDKCSLDIFWLKDESLEDPSKLPDPHILATEIAEDLRSALEQIESVLGDLQQRAVLFNREP